MDSENIDNNCNIPEKIPDCDENAREKCVVAEMFADVEVGWGKKIVVKEFLDETETKYYDKAKNYWSTIPPTVDGMLGGFGKLTYTDIRGSANFLQALFKLKPAPERKYALDCGAGIGRVTKNLLLPHFDRVDMVEQDKNFCDQAREYVGGEVANTNLGEIFNEGLQDFTPEAKKYDIVWSQWVLGHLKDGHLVEFLERCIKGLKKNGMIVVKDNFTKSGKIEIDTTDNSVTRPLNHMKELFERANLRIIREQRQANIPQGLFPVYIIALKSKSRN